ncbi:hypothetical protein H4R33_003304 [Dimargaris cristalligena]|uniref:Uncharacterized protein n=1 Tax=Dimargaris cristalligena TaxID=215637 RepID=A0A4P9ZNV1_9FUNG|nr:hypothetical protein H4R33_003304 [Dimargaris cristalligena]RKP34222.1 hypothetical protein BJ085DRAFT_39903 [Dimargaris cristalligena]|eukprot:RKP34222.1 hypothetical protein BJ085DRAFT_39903 [Dimargaris cristalligena]
MADSRSPSPKPAPPKPRKKRGRRPGLQPVNKHVALATIERKWAPIPSHLYPAVRDMVDASVRSSLSQPHKGSIADAMRESLDIVQSRIFERLDKLRVPQIYDNQSIPYEDLYAEVRTQENNLLEELDYLYRLESNRDNQERTIQRIIRSIQVVKDANREDQISDTITPKIRVRDLEPTDRLGLIPGGEQAATQCLTLAQESGYNPDQDDSLQLVQTTLFSHLANFHRRVDRVDTLFSRLIQVRQRLGNLMVQLDSRDITDTFQQYP